MLKLLKKIFKREEREEQKHSGLALIQKFTTEDEPKVADYPKGAYSAFWEILVNDIPGGYVAHVRFYRYEDSVMIKETEFIAPFLAKLKRQVNEHIRSEMKQYAR